MNPATQKGKILGYNSPSKRISELRKSGFYDVQSITETRVNADGDEVKFKRYFITALEGGVS